MSTPSIPTIEKGIYEHYKGNRYEVIGVATHTETLETLVVYRSVDPGDGKPQYWVRPHDMFVESVEVDGQLKPRFKKIEQIQK